MRFVASSCSTSITWSAPNSRASSSLRASAREPGDDDRARADRARREHAREPALAGAEDHDGSRRASVSRNLDRPAEARAERVEHDRELGAAAPRRSCARTLFGCSHRYCGVGAVQTRASRAERHVRVDHAPLAQVRATGQARRAEATRDHVLDRDAVADVDAPAPAPRARRASRSDRAARGRGSPAPACAARPSYCS